MNIKFYLTQVPIPNNDNYKINFDDESDKFNPFSIKNNIYNESLKLNNNSIKKFINLCSLFKINYDLNNQIKFKLSNKYHQQIYNCLNISSIINNVLTKNKKNIFNSLKTKGGFKSFQIILQCDIYDNYIMTINLESIIFNSLIDNKSINQILTTTIERNYETNF